ncbi:hypothetical protein J6590_081892 [Homalodisca vitripennis]|nr:hypothetical protein J6590_081892 [Homalodisca vitripennis]
MLGKVRPWFSIRILNHHDRCRSYWVRSGHGSVSVYKSPRSMSLIQGQAPVQYPCYQSPRSMSIMLGKVRPRFSIRILNHHDRCRSCWVRSGHGLVSVFSITTIDVDHAGYGQATVQYP